MGAAMVKSSFPTGMVPMMFSFSGCFTVSIIFLLQKGPLKIPRMPVNTVLPKSFAVKSLNTQNIRSPLHFILRENS